MNSTPVSPFGVELENEALFVRGDFTPLKARVEVVDPAQTTALAGAFET